MPADSPKWPPAQKRATSGDVAAAGATARQVLRQWLAKLPDDEYVGPVKTIIERLAARTGADMDKAWCDLRRFDEPLALAHRAAWAAEYAAAELQRPSSARDERAGIERVASAARELRRAIEASTLPRNTLNLRTLRYEPNDPVQLEVGWHDVSIEGHFAPVIVLSELADDIAALAEDHLANLAMRSIARRHRRPTDNNLRRAAFVRWLHYQLNQAYGGGHLLLSVAEVTNAIFVKARLDGLTHRDVQAIIKDAPAQFRGRPKRPFVDALRRLRTPTR